MRILFSFMCVLALGVMGCSETAGTGGIGGTGGEGGGGGGTGGVEVEPGSYRLGCMVDTGLEKPPGLPISLIIHISAVNPGFTKGMPSDLATSLDLEIDPVIPDFLREYAPEAQFTEVNATIRVTGGTPVEILHNTTEPALPFEPTNTFSSTEVTTAVTPGESEVSLAVTAFSARVEGIPWPGVESGEIVLAPGNPSCGALAPSQGSGPLTFEVQP